MLPLLQQEVGKAQTLFFLQSLLRVAEAAELMCLLAPIEMVKRGVLEVGVVHHLLRQLPVVLVVRAIRLQPVLLKVAMEEVGPQFHNEM